MTLRLIPPVLELDPALAEGRVLRLDDDDERFDELYPPSVRCLSDVHWTQVRVARRVAERLDLPPGARVLDVGSGVGKFCLVAASFSRASFVGVEKRAALVSVAESTRRLLGAEEAKAHFIQGDAFALDWRTFDALYFYNPFGDENLEEEERIDAIPVAIDEYRRSVALATERLATLPLGTRIVLYHGFGGSMPASYQCLSREWSGTGVLEVWRKVRT